MGRDGRAKAIVSECSPLRHHSGEISLVTLAIYVWEGFLFSVELIDRPVAFASSCRTNLKPPLSLLEYHQTYPSSGYWGLV
jgi:hypothetical protein